MSTCEISVKTFSELTTEELYIILRLRSEVFVVEQKCIYQDIDNYDQDALHVCAYANNELQAYTRIIKPEIKYIGASSVGRVLTNPSSRSQGLGKEIVMAAIKQCNEVWPSLPITISAQQYLEKFYSELGFDKKSDAYMEDDIPHIEMTLQPSN